MATSSSWRRPSAKRLLATPKSPWDGMRNRNSAFDAHRDPNRASCSASPAHDHLRARLRGRVVRRARGRRGARHRVVCRPSPFARWRVLVLRVCRLRWRGARCGGCTCSHLGDASSCAVRSLVHALDPRHYGRGGIRLARVLLGRPDLGACVSGFAGFMATAIALSYRYHAPRSSAPRGLSDLIAD